jgi:hypothetical protein
MMGFLLHLVEPWNGLRHVLIVAQDASDMLHQAAECSILKRGGKSKMHRVVRCFSTPEDWREFERCSFTELCSECGHG